MIPLNQQPVEHQALDPSGNLDIVNVFYTIQGEGPFAGTPAVFIRTAGCNLSSVCKLCDTSYTEGRKLFTVEEIVSKVQHLMPSPGLVVLTGGEPLRQNVIPLIRHLYALGYGIQIETNGTLSLYAADMPDLRSMATIVCSPKTGSINEKLKPYIQHLKYIVAYEKVDPVDGLPTDSLGAGVRVARPWKDFKGQIWIQPLDEQDEEKNKLHMQAAVEVCLKHPSYRFCLQIHKLLGLP